MNKSDFARKVLLRERNLIALNSFLPARTEGMKWLTTYGLPVAGWLPSPRAGDGLRAGWAGSYGGRG